MKHKLTLDFGTTNSAIACWNDEQGAAEIVNLPHISQAPTKNTPALVPSLLYVQNGVLEEVIVGQAVRDNNLDQQQNNRLFRNFKRSLVTSHRPKSRQIDGTPWGDHDAGRRFIQYLLQMIPYQKDDLEQLVLTAPVESFERYLAWLNDVIQDLAPEQVHVVDESTAAALGYAVTEPEAVVLVFDFGGGTLDMSLVQLPESREKTGGLLKRLGRKFLGRRTARVIAKAGRTIGGSDIDHWLLADVLKRINLEPTALGQDYAPLLTLCERAKITLSTVETTNLTFKAAGKHHSLTITRSDLETVLEENGFYTALRYLIDKVMHSARRQGIFREDINYVLLVGGTSLMPSVQTLLKQYFSNIAVRADKPFTAVVEGGLQVAAGFGLEDYLVHGYGLRHLDPITGNHQYEELIPMGTPYPIQDPIELVLEAAYPDQTAIEFVIGEINTDAISTIEVKYENDQPVFVAQANNYTEHVILISQSDSEETGPILADLVPPGKPGKDRLKAQFTVDEQRQLRLTVIDLQANKPLLTNVRLASLR